MKQRYRNVINGQFAKLDYAHIHSNRVWYHTILHAGIGFELNSLVQLGAHYENESYVSAMAQYAVTRAFDIMALELLMEAE